MKTETLVILGVLAYLFLKSKSVPCYPANFTGPIPPGAALCPPTGTGSGSGSGGGGTGGGVTWISCDDPSADPVMCAQLLYGGWGPPKLYESIQ